MPDRDQTRIRNQSILTADKKKDPAARWILAGIPFISVIGSLMHFVFEWTGGLAAAGLIAPVNESVWEHLKLIFWPALFWLVIGYPVVANKNDIPASRWFSFGAAGLYAGPLFITAFYYTYTGAFGIHSLFLDIVSFILGAAAGQFLTLHIYRCGKADRTLFCFASAAVILLALALVLFTFSPPEIPLFRDPVTGGYGIP